MSEAEKCPKCGSEKKEADKIVGYGSIPVHIWINKDRGTKMVGGDRIVPFHCPNCGYIELYNGKNIKK
jgi:predicted nucleic-acid-binding Zn-ribbon protein